jgi:undecaprenyl-diphosphatase
LGVLVAIVLGAVQGLTEFLPVSSSAHLILVRLLFGLDADRLGMAFDVACHVGTLVAVVGFFRQDLVAMAVALPGMFQRAAVGPARRLQLIAIGTLPIVGAGLAVAGGIEERLRTPLVASVTLALGGLLFLWVEHAGARRRSEESLGFGEGLAIGVAQAVALVPGVSRSGATMTVGMAFGLTREAAARFSFVLGIPAIAAAAGHEGLHLLKVGLTSSDAGMFAVGMVTSALVGYVAIKYLLRYLVGHSLAVFAWYRIAVAGLVLGWWLAGRVA